MIGNGVCNDETNNPGCFYDGGDCCVNINKDHCTDCICYHQENCAFGFTLSEVGDGICNDETNNADCNYDGGDCCVNVNKDVRTDCDCISGGVITSPGIPENYDNNLNLTWLIEVPPGRKIQIRFLSFDVENCGSCMYNFVLL